MHDLFEAELSRWSHVEALAKKVFEGFGYGEIRTPVLEHKEVFSQTVGEDTDIVEKQMYSVESEEKIVLRPEGTAAFIRAVLEHQLHQTGKSQRFYYYLPMFRHERPQKGRLRQFHQFGAELINDSSPEADVEIIALLHALFSKLGISEYEIRVNSVGCGDCRPAYKEKLKAYFKPKLSQLCPQCQGRFDRAPMRILDCKNETCKGLAAGAPKMLDNLCEVCRTHHAKVKSRLTALSIPFKEDASIVRGLDYYIRTAFEFDSPLLGAQSALAGGGRYDGLATRFGEKPIPAVGFGMGMERLMMVLEQKGFEAKKPSPFAYFAPLGDAAFEKLYPVSFRLREKGLPIELAYEARSLKSHLKNADRSDARFAVMVGDDELKSGKFLLKDMKAGTQESLDLSRLEEELLRRERSKE